MLVSALTAMRLAIHGREVSVPSLTGMTPADAEDVALRNGLLLQVESRFFSADVPEGRIISQAPQAGARVRRGWRVRVAESMGPQRAVIPNVVGQSPRAAELNLQRRGLELGTVAVAHLPGLPPDQIVAQSPPPNARGVASQKINLLVTAPEEQPQYLMPDFTGRPFVEAAKAIADAGFKLGTISAVNGGPTNTAAAKVVGQTPAAGQRVSAGATVSFEVVPQ
jgi:beta-lactam-binding protein with PASTA domain